MNLSTKTKHIPNHMQLIAGSLENYIKDYDPKASESQNKELETSFWLEAESWNPLKSQMPFNTFNGNDLQSTKQAIAEIKATIADEPQMTFYQLESMFYNLLNSNFDLDYIKEAYCLFSKLNSLMLSLLPEDGE